MFCLKLAPPLISCKTEVENCSSRSSVVVCALKGPRPRYPRVWKKRERIGTISKSAKLVDCIKGLSNVKEEVYGALDSFVAWELEFPLIAVKKALKILESQQEWKRIIQVIKWMLSKGQGRTMGTYFTLLNALAEDGRLEEAEELWTKLFSQNLEGMPRIFFDKMISIYYKRDMHEKLFEIFADMEELGVKPNVPIVNMIGNVFQKLGMLDKYDKLKKKYPPPKWEYRYIKGKRVRVQAKNLYEVDGANRREKNVNEIARVNEGAHNTHDVARVNSGAQNVHDVACANGAAQNVHEGAGAIGGANDVHEGAGAIGGANDVVSEVASDDEAKNIHEVVGVNRNSELTHLSDELVEERTKSRES